ncbi:MAG: ATP-binding protein [Anaerolineae bacterium]|nr:ATP-binding protein [Anaerolineae bacterium]
MNKSLFASEPELQISPKPVFVVLLAVGCLLFLVVEALSYPWEVVERVISLSLLFSGLALSGLLLVDWNAVAGRWFAVLALVAAVHLAGSWLEVPGHLAWAVIPTAMAVPLVGLAAATMVAAGETVSIVLLTSLSGGELDTSEAAVALVAIWGVLSAMYTTRYPIYQYSTWLREYFELAQRRLEEARGLKGDLKQTLDNLANANRQLALANERMASLRAIAEEAQRAKTAFVASVSHEFRTPLNMIIGLVDLMFESPEIYDMVLSPKMREDLEVVRRNCEHLSNMINDVLDLTQTEAGRLSLHREQVDLRQIVESSVEAVRPLLEKKHLALQVVIPDDLPQVYCDRTRIRQVILNLLSNAARFTEVGGITIALACQDQQVMVSVTDTGPGIAPEDAVRVFEPFWQGTRQLWRDKGGSGLGLSISKRFVELHGGRMWFESKPGVGSSFYFTLPISLPVEHIVRPGHQLREEWIWREQAFRAGQPSSAEQLVRPRIIVCDETGMLYPRFTRYLDRVEFVNVEDPSQAERSLRECPASAVMLNVVDADDPWALVEMVRKRAPGTPVIGCSVPRLTERAIHAGAAGYLIKPITRADLERVLKAVGKPVKRVLVVDDDLEFLELLSRMLRTCDSTLEVVTAASGKEALAELRSAPPDLLLLDIVMPGMNGWQVLETMRQEGRLKDVLTFFVSAQDPAEQPPASDYLLVTIDGGLSLSKLLRCSLEVSTLLLAPERGLDLTPR